MNLTLLIVIVAIALGAVVLMAQTPPATRPVSAYDFVVRNIEGNDVNLRQYAGKVLLIVNTASKCGHTPQYAALEKLHRQYKDRGLVVLGFPANDFRSQEPGTDEQIRQFCTEKYDVTFPLFSKISVAKGENQAPLYAWLTSEAAGEKTAGAIKWNFTKFLVGHDGKVIARFEPKIKPDDPQVIDAIEAALGK